MDRNQPLGPNVKKLIAACMASLMIPPGTTQPFQTGLRALADIEHVKRAAREATQWVASALAVMKTAQDNPWGDDDEVIAGELLRRIAERQHKKGEV